MSYRPWRFNQRISKLTYLGIAALLGLSAGGVFDWRIAIVLSAGLFLIARSQTRKARAREFGKQFEGREITKAVGELTRHGLAVTPNTKMSSGGDVDMLVERKGGVFGQRKATVEIKSFGYWHVWLLFWEGGREQRALRQAIQQKQATRSDATVIWLPQGRKSRWQSWWWSRFPRRRGVHLVFGDTQELAAALNKII